MGRADPATSTCDATSSKPMKRKKAWPTAARNAGAENGAAWTSPGARPSRKAAAIAISAAAASSARSAAVATTCAR